MCAGKNGRPKRTVVDIDGDGSFLMNVQELATAKVDGLETKVFILNNQHLGMVVQWEDRFYKANRAHTYLGRREGANDHFLPLSAGRHGFEMLRCLPQLNEHTVRDARLVLLTCTSCSGAHAR